jgi:secondary thiamine-phosphate synthase enzyme
MPIHQVTLTVTTRGTGTYEITDRVSTELRRSGLRQGVLTLFCRHTSASLMIFENADPTARADLEEWINRLVPEEPGRFTHEAEGADDMPAHLKMALTRTSESIPFAEGRLLLGSWQGIFLWEHRVHPQQRSVVVTVMGE